MRLRARLQNALTRRLQALYPRALETVWDTVSAVCVIEQLRFTPAGQHQGDYRQMAHFSGQVVAELRLDGPDEALGGLCADLIYLPVTLTAEPDRTRTEEARIRLVEYRDRARDTDVVASLRFEVQGCLLKQAPPTQARPGEMQPSARGGPKDTAQGEFRPLVQT